MNSQYSILHFFTTILDHVSDLVSGVERIVGIFSISDRDKDEIIGLSLLAFQNTFIKEDVNIEGAYSQLQKLQMEKFSYKWLSISDTPFSISSSKNNQLSIFSEQDKIVLLLSLLIPQTQSKSLIFIYFREGIDQFGISHQKGNLSTQNKSIIGHLISNSVNSFCRIYWEKEEKLKRFIEKSKEIFSQQKEQKEYDESSKYKEFINSWLDSITMKFSQRDCVNYVYTKEAIQKIIECNCSFDDLKRIIVDAIEYAKLFNQYQDNLNVIIEKEYITYVNNENISHTMPSSHSPRTQRAIDLLDKLEKHATLINQKGIKLTSHNVGLSMEKSITPAAISDSISKNKDRINILFEQNPTKWQFIRNNFRPIINIIEKKDNNLKNWG